MSIFSKRVSLELGSCARAKVLLEAKKRNLI